MSVIELTLAAPQSALKMTSRAKKRIKSPPYEPPGLTEHERLYIKALEQELIEQRLRVQLYQTVISQASEELGVDILKKLGAHRSGP
jgi:hypothetical protein